jgi:pimeloyl-ACP methyl ester carboxylesterase
MELAKLNAVKFAGPCSAANRLSAMYVLHGLMGSANSWRTIAQKMQQYHTIREKLSAIHCIDLRNHGSSEHKPRHTNALMCSDVEHFIATHRRTEATAIEAMTGAAAVGRSVLVGHSMGGAVGMAMMIRQANRQRWTAAGHTQLPGDSQDILKTMELVPNADRDMLDRTLPGALGGAVIVDINPLAERPPAIDKIEADLRLLLSLDLKSIRSLTDAHSQLARSGLIDSNMRNFLLTNLVFMRSTDASGNQRIEASWRCNLKTIVDDLDSFLFNLTPEMAPQPCDLPIVFVYGKNSPYNRKEYRRNVEKFFTNVVDMIEIEDAGHFVHYEKMNEFIEHVAPHIDRFFS